MSVVFPHKVSRTVLILGLTAVNSFALEFLGVPCPVATNQIMKRNHSHHPERESTTITNFNGMCCVSSWQEVGSSFTSNTLSSSVCLSNWNDRVLEAVSMSSRPTNCMFSTVVDVSFLPEAKRISVIPETMVFEMFDVMVSVPLISDTNCIISLLSQNCISNRDSFVRYFSFDGVYNRGIHGNCNNETTFDSSLCAVLEKTSADWNVKQYMIVGIFTKEALVGLYLYQRSFQMFPALNAQERPLRDTFYPTKTKMPNIQAPDWEELK